MIAETPKRLPENLDLPCYFCEKQPSTHVCRFKIGELLVQMCLCPECMQMDVKMLLEHTIVLQEGSETVRAHPVNGAAQG